MAQHVLRALHQIAPQHLVALLGDPQLLALAITVPQLRHQPGVGRDILERAEPRHVPQLGQHNLRQRHAQPRRRANNLPLPLLGSRTRLGEPCQLLQRLAMPR